MMEDYIDEFMAANNFHRKGKSLNYSRKIKDTNQQIEMIVHPNPSYQPGAIMHIYPWLSVYYPRVNEWGIQMVKDINLVAGLDKSTIRQPIQILTDSKRWMLMHEEDYKSLAE